VLGICRHGLPRTHLTHWEVGAGFRLGGSCCRQLNWTGRRRSYNEAWESLEAWRRYSREAAQILRLSTLVHVNGGFSVDDAAEVNWLPTLHVDDAQVQRQAIAARVNQWLALGDVRPRLDWGLNWDNVVARKIEDNSGRVSVREPPPLMRFGYRPITRSGSDLISTVATSPWHQGTTLFGAVAWRLALAVIGSTVAAVCTSCGRLHSPRRRPAAGRNSYCGFCGRHAAMRAASTRYRQRQLSG
jgi:hypothetical protein